MKPATLPRPVVLVATCLACGREVDPWQVGGSLQCRWQECTGRLFVAEAEYVVGMRTR